MRPRCRRGKNGASPQLERQEWLTGSSHPPPPSTATAIRGPSASRTAPPSRSARLALAHKHDPTYLAPAAKALCPS